MYKKALLPLDGSELAECTLGHAEDLALTGAIEEVTLLHVVEVPERLIENFEPVDIKNELYDKAQTYLSDIESRLTDEGLKVTTALIEGPAAESIIDYSKKNDYDLIIIATHGATGMRNLMFGSVALKVLHHSHTPVMTIRPEACRF